jgi:alpha-tubulin suppressor-like RCC1 family protein
VPTVWRSSLTFPSIATATLMVLIRNAGSVFVSGTMVETFVGVTAAEPRYGQARPWHYVSAVRGKLIVQIALGTEHLLLLTSEGHVYACGANKAGELGLGDQNRRNSPR